MQLLELQVLRVPIRRGLVRCYCGTPSRLSYALLRLLAFSLLLSDTVSRTQFFFGFIENLFVFRLHVHGLAVYFS